MFITYDALGGGVQVLPTLADWKRNTDGGRFVRRSSELRAIDTALATFEATPSIANFEAVERNYGAWSRTKLNRYGVVESRRQPASDILGDHTRQHKLRLAGKTAVKNDLERMLEDTVDWKTKALCAELYYDPEDVRWAPLSAVDVTLLGNEATLSSGWAQVIMNTNMQQWSDWGEGEIARLQAWPNFLGGVFRMRNSGALNANGGRIVPANRAPVVRKGLFCHSFAAIAANVVFQNRRQLISGPFRIRSIELINHRPAPNQAINLMNHWWLCVNKPHRLYLGGGAGRAGAREVRFDTFDDFVDFLPLCGGFIVDMWGALWRDQADQARVQRFIRARDQFQIPDGAVWDEPFDFLDSQRLISHGRQTFP